MRCPGAKFAGKGAGQLGRQGAVQRHAHQAHLGRWWGARGRNFNMELWEQDRASAPGAVEGWPSEDPGKHTAGLLLRAQGEMEESGREVQRGISASYPASGINAPPAWASDQVLAHRGKGEGQDQITPPHRPGEARAPRFRGPLSPPPLPCICHLGASHTSLSLASFNTSLPNGASTCPSPRGGYVVSRKG